MCFGGTPDTPAPVATPITPAPPPDRYGTTDALKPGDAQTTTDNQPAGSAPHKLSTVNPAVNSGTTGLQGPM